MIAYCSVLLQCGQILDHEEAVLWCFRSFRKGDSLEWCGVPGPKMNQAKPTPVSLMIHKKETGKTRRRSTWKPKQPLVMQKNTSWRHILYWNPTLCFWLCQETQVAVETPASKAALERLPGRRRGSMRRTTVATCSRCKVRGLR